MRLLYFSERGELRFTKDLTDDIPKYAILSHTWGPEEEEVTFKDLKNGLIEGKAGYAKIRFCGEQAQTDGLSHFWVDTCCIDKENQVELAEAINSMFRWYRQAVKCYVYLADVAVCKRDSEGVNLLWDSAFQNSRWFTRGWTLQELLAPTTVQFYSRDRKFLGNKITLQQKVHEATQIPIAAIQGAALSEFTVEERMRWVAKRNTKRPEDKWYCLLGIFNVYMSPIYGEGENAQFRLKDEIGKSFSRQVQAIPQMYLTPDLHSLQNAGTRPIPATIDKTSLEEYRKASLMSISFDQMDSRRTTIRPAQPATCAWLLKHAAYVDWIDPKKFHQHCGFLWINGKPGAGKSTLLKFAHANVARDRREYEIIISFFFNARGDKLEKSTVGMYRALLFQLLNEAPDLQEVFDKFYRPSEHRMQHPEWTIEVLCGLLTSAVARLKQRQLKCFIDALDECDEHEVREMIAFLEELGQHALKDGNQIYICFASRHYPTIDIRNGQQLTLEHEHGHDEDLSKYIQSHLRAGNGKHTEKIKAQIQEKANGVFMWVILVIPILNKEFRNGRVFAVKKRLQEIPAELSNLFKHILRRDKDNMADFLLCLQWILFARQPLEREEFYFAMVAGLDSDCEDVVEWDREVVTRDQMDRFVHSSSKGLAELTKHKTPKVQFIHESVRDFLIGEGGLCELWPELSEDLHSSSHDRLKQCCLNYLTVDLSGCVSPDEPLPKAFSAVAKATRVDLMTKFPFLYYASKYVLTHADEAARGISQDLFVTRFDLSSWIRISNLLEPAEIRRHTPNASLLYLLAEHNLARLIKVGYRHGERFDIKGERYCYPLFAALANGHRDAIRALVQHDNSPSSEDVLAGVDCGESFSYSKRQTPFLWALENGYQALAESIMTVSDIDFGMKDRRGRTVMDLAARGGCNRIVSYIIDTHPSALKSGGQVESAWYHAVEMGRHNVVALLFNKAPLSLLSYRNMLYKASACGHAQIAQTLLQAGADVNAQGGCYGNALQAAAVYGRCQVVQTLLQAGADVNAQGGCYGSALQAAAAHGYNRVVQTLLQAGVDVNTQEEYNGNSNALQAAAAHGHNQVVQTLLQAGADVDALGDALEVAADRNHRLVVDILLEAGAKPPK